jgi:hypothetical protein
VNNVRCAGVNESVPGGSVVLDPCGWEGQLAGGVVDLFDCPDCGGRVVLVEGESAPEMRGEWPGGIATDQNGHAKYEAVVGATPRIPGNEVVRPVWECPLCAGKRKHTKAEHDALTAKVAR